MSFILHCIVTSGTATSVVWLKDNTLLIINSNPRFSNGNVQTPSLTITNVQQSDQGNYVCRASNAKTTVNTNTIIVTPQDPLAVNAPVTSYSPTIGTTVTLNCVVTSGTATSIVWLKDNNVLNINTNTRYSNGNVQTPPLTITNVLQSDQGNYVCSAANLQTTVNTNAIAVNLQGIVYPSITVSPTSGSTDIGTATYTITCTVTATPQATSWSWTKTPIGGGQSTTIDQGTNDNKYTVANSASSPSLTIKNVQTSDQANYVCTATNSAGTQSSSPSQLTVTGGLLGVTIAPSNQMVIRGNSQTITCTITGTPAVQAVTWLKNSQTVTIDGSKYSSGGSTNTPTLTITNFQSSDAATYNCRAANAAGSTLSPNSVLTYGDIPQVNIQQSLYNVNYGDDVTLVCTVVANPQATSVYWHKFQNGLTTVIARVENDARLSGVTLGTPSLTITNVNLNDMASYTCFALNIVGTGQSSLTILQVSGSPPTVVVLSTGYAVDVGGQVTLQCVVTSNPVHTSVKWQRLVNGQIQDVTNVGAVGSNSRLTGSTVSSPSLTISQTTFNDEGSYICTATNDVGTGSSQQTFLDVRGITSSTEKLPITTPSEDKSTKTDSVGTDLPDDSYVVARNILIGVVVILLLIQIIQIVLAYWMYRKGYLSCKKKLDYEDTQRYSDQHRYNEMSHRTADDNISHIYNVVL